ncbi:hypothetical protein ACFWGI_39765 [Streptomyces niveus]|uniref:hypothetical protein n=1 Tax=Streptomyces niveus TaxID=193462 RepID=UPI0036578CFF
MTQTSTERRERYAAAICTAEGRDWEEIKASYPDDAAEYLRMADAALAVADEEQHGLRDGIRVLEEAARAHRALLEEARDALEAAGITRAHGDHWPQLAPAIDTLASERDEAREQCTEMERQRRFALEESRGRVDGLRAEVEKVRAAVHEVRRLCDLTIDVSIHVEAVNQARDTLAILDRHASAQTTEGATSPGIRKPHPGSPRTSSDPTTDGSSPRRDRSGAGCLPDPQRAPGDDAPGGRTQ